MLSLLLSSLLLVAPPAPNPLVVPGRSLGNLCLGATDATLASLGPAADGDGAMMKSWGTWYGHPASGPRTQLDVYSSLRDAGALQRIRMVRATSPWFHTAGGLRAGSTLAQARQAAGPLALAGTYRLTPGTAPRYVYDNVKTGLAVETTGPAADSRCVSLIVHEPGTGVLETYLSMTDYLQGLASE